RSPDSQWTGSRTPVTYRFLTRYAEALSRLRILCPRGNRGQYAEQPRHLPELWTGPRSGRKHELAARRPRTRFVRVLEQSVTTLSPRKWPRPRTVNGKGTNCPQPVRGRVCGPVAHRLRTQIVHVREQSAIMSVRTNGRVHEQPMSATNHGLGQSVNRQRQRARIIGRQSAVAWRWCV